MRIALALAVPPLLAPFASAGDGSIPFKKFTLDNGLELVVHEDHSDPVVAVYVYYHVGSAREVPGRSGFAHLFEHVLFQGSEHVGDDQHFKLVSEAGGTLNGSTTRDRTNYFEVLPANQLELALWLESDRMGFLLPAVTLEKLDNQRDVVKNERRQNYENRPYGQAAGAIAAALYPAEHPYHWLTIGSQEDLTAASLEDVKGFFRRWYGPNNATLAIGGDIKTDEVVALVKKYFGGIPRGPEVAREAARPAKLAESVRLSQEDRVKLPQLAITWPTVAFGHADEPALDFLASVLAANRSSVLEKALRIDEALASQVDASNEADELAGEFSIRLRPVSGTRLDVLEKRTREILTKLAADGVDPAQLERVKARYEAGRIRRLETVSARTSQLANDNVSARDPGWFDADVRRHLAVTPQDVVRVLKEYVLERPAVVLSVVPQGKLELAAVDSKPVSKEVRVADAKPAVDAAPAKAVTVADGLDRSKKPGPGPAPSPRFPAVWHVELANGVRAVGTPYRELPMTSLAFSVPAGRMRETPKTLGLASLTAEMMQQGTAALSSNEFQQELDRLGASINVSAGEEDMGIGLNVLDKHRAAAVALVADVLLRPRFAAEDFERVKRERLVAIDTRGDQIRMIAGEAYRRLLWGDSTPAGLSSMGTRESVSALTLDDVKGFWRENVVPDGARLTYAGALDVEGTKKLFESLSSSWKSSGKPVEIAARVRGQAVPSAAKASALPIEKTRLYLVDKPGAAQSEIRIGRVSVASTDPSFYPLTVMNQILGGQFSSRINLNLRESKGYTYGARTSFEGGITPGAFTASAAVKTDVTKESVVEFMKELASIREGVTDEELAFVKDSLAQGTSRQYESTMALLGYLDNVGRYGWPDDYGARRLTELAALRRDDLKKLAEGHVLPDAMVILVVGDKARIGKGLAELGYGEPIELDIDGQLVPSPTAGH